MVYKFFDKKSSGSGIKNISNKELAEKWHKSIIRKFNERKLHSLFIDNNWVVNLADMGLGFYYVLLIFIANMRGLFL